MMNQAPAERTMTFDDRAKTWDDDPVKRERADAVAAAIRLRIPLTTAWRALEYGCGTGLLSFALQSDLGHITLFDSSPVMLAVLAEKIATARFSHFQPLAVDLTVGPLPAERYDLIYSLMTLHHIPDTDQILRALHDLLKPGGWLAIADLDREDGSFHGADFDGHPGFDRTLLGAQLTAAGFSTVSFSTCYVMKKEAAQNLREYPVFLAVAKR